MDIVLDACSIINLVNGNCIDRVLCLDHKFYVGDMLLEQEILSNVQKIMIEALIQKNYLKILPSNVSLQAFKEFNKKFNLGLGETECILLCKSGDFVICTDDRKARICSETELGTDKVVGSLYLLRASVKAAIMSCAEAIGSYGLMRVKGGFLPSNLNEKYFCID